MVGEEGVCVYEYMWHARINSCTRFMEGDTRWGKKIYINIGGMWWGRSKEGIVHISITCYMCCIFVIYVYKFTNINSTLSCVQ